MTTHSINSDMLARMFKQAGIKLNQHREQVDALNVFPVPDGDTGTNMSLTMKAATQEILVQSFTTVDEVAKSVSKGSLMGARGNSGVILSQIFRGFAKGCSGKSELVVADFAEALKQAAETAYKAVLKPVEGTILTVIRETGERAVALDLENMSFEVFLNTVIEQAEKTLAETPKHLEALRQAKVVDAGGKGLVYILMGFKEAYLGLDTTHQPPAVEAPFVAQERASFENLSTTEIRFSYCTEFLVRGTDLDSCPLMTDIVDLGDSMVYVPDDTIIKVHIHTNEPGVVLQKALQYGELLNIKIENMKEQHQHVLIQADEFEAAEAEKTVKPFGFIAVAMGEGIEAIFKDLKVDEIIAGGQTMNPSTEDFHLAIENISAEHIFIFPNNSNIILAANQAKELTTKKVYVLPTKTIPQGIGGMLAFNPDTSADGNFDEMLKAVHRVKTVQVTFAVRDTEYGGLKIHKDDILGIVDGEITASEKNVESAVLKTVAHAIEDIHEIVTVYYGSDVTEADAEAMRAAIEEQHPDLEVECYSGGQPLYYYIIALE